MRIFNLVLTAFSISLTFSQDYEKKVFIRNNDSLPYRILLPENYNPEITYPLIMFLHGAGERGNDNYKQLVHGSILFKSEAFRKQYPAITIFPQCPKNSYWASVEKRQSKKINKRFKYHKKLSDYNTMELLENFLYDLDKTYKIDPSKRYVGGLSMGGMVAFELVARIPNYFAAAISICGGGNPKWAKTLANTPFWIFHGTSDDVVSYKYSKKMYKKMKSFNNHTKLTFYKDVKHNSWENAFAETQFLHWLFSFKKNTNKKHL